ncbi:MAG: hypothetical protein LBE91_19705 [Tannerella sp.]|nr:hypothetical protein [Tannerella sp.]
MMRAIRISLFLLFLVSLNFTEVCGQRNIKGRIIDEDLDELIGAKIFEFNPSEEFGFDNNKPLGTSDFNGYFDIVAPNGTERFVFTYIGFEFANVTLSDSCNYVEIILLYDAIYDFMSSREVDRRRKKSFDNLSLLHLRAVEKGLFSSETICYSREFAFIKPRLDEIGKQIKAAKKKIKHDYRNLSVGDTVQIPFSGRRGADGTERTILHTWSNLTDTEHFDCIIEGVVIRKFRKRYKYRNLKFPWINLEKGYDFTYRVTNCENCKFDDIFYDGKAIETGQIFEHDMKIFKTILK